MKTAFKTPSSSSCIRIHDEHKIQAKSKLRQFAWKCVLERKIIQSDMHREEENGHVLPLEQENPLEGCSPPPHYRLHSSSRTTSQAEATRLRRLKSSTRANVLRCVISRCFPILSKRSSGIKHRGHGQRPRFRILAMRILQYT
jgi:hypothetical protein